MKVAVFSTKPYDRRSLMAAKSVTERPHEISFFEAHLEG